MKAPSVFGESLSTRLTLIYGLTSMLVVAALGLGVYALTERYLTRQMESELEGLAEFYAAYTSAIALEWNALEALAPQIVGFFAPQAGYDVRFFDARTGGLVASSRELGPLPSSSALAQLGSTRPSYFVTSHQDEPERLYSARQVVDGGGSTIAVVELSRDVSQLQQMLSTLRLILAAAGGLALIVAWAASLAVARHVTRPLLQMEIVTRSIAAGDLTRRLDVERGDEVGRLAASVNHMAAQLATLEASRRDFIARISHDLRTPLTAIKGLVLNLQDTAPAEVQSSLAVVEEQTERLIRLVDDLLTVSRARRGQLRLVLCTIDLRTIAGSAASLARGKAETLGVRLALEQPDDVLQVSGDADRLQQVALNLLDNALRASSAGDHVTIAVQAGEDAVSLSVRDGGQELSAEDAVRAFEPYVRGPGGGAGLGLTIAREIVEAHGGRIWLKARPEGGSEAGFELPNRGPGNSDWPGTAQFGR